MNEKEVLVLSPLLPELLNQLEDCFYVHRLWEEKDPTAYLQQNGAHIEALVSKSGQKVEASLLELLPQLKMISNFGVGVDTIDFNFVRKRGIRVSHTPHVLSDCVADTALALLLSLVRRISEADRFIRAGRWVEGSFPLGVNLKGKKVGIVGLGSIGRAIALRAKAFGLELSYQGPHEKKDVPYRYFTELKAMASEVDFLILSLPGGQATYHLVDAEILQALGPDGFLINISRGSVVDQKALVEMLVSRQLKGAALDVFEDEPRVPSALFKLNHVVLTPHLASGTEETRQAMGDLTFRNLQAYFNQSPLPSEVEGLSSL